MATQLFIWQTRKFLGYFTSAKSDQCHIEVENMFPMIRRLLTNIPRVISSIEIGCQNSRCFGIFSINRPFDSNAVSFLKPNLPLLTHSCGLKYKGKPKLRCKYCYKVYIDGRLFIKCFAKGRHKQAQLWRKPKNTWELAHATQGKVRPW